MWTVELWSEKIVNAQYKPRKGKERKCINSIELSLKVSLIVYILAQ